MAPRADPVRSDEALPARVAVVVIGGGIIGASTAFFLAQRGVPTLLCEKGHIAGEQSSRNWGWCRLTGRDPREIPLAIESLRLWRGMNGMVGAETGFRQSGIAQLCETEADVARAEAWLDFARPYQLDSQLLPGERVRDLFGESARRWAALLHTPSDGRAEPRHAAPAIATAAQGLGATIVQSCAVRGIETAAGRVAGVVTEKGRVACDSVVLAGGAWSRLLCGSQGLNLRQLNVMTSVLRTAKMDGGPETAAIANGLAFRKEIGGGYIISQANRNVVDVGPDHLRLIADFRAVLRMRWKRIHLRIGARAVRDWCTPRRWSLDGPSPFERTRVLDPRPYQPFLGESLRNTAAAFPFFRNAKIAESWAGVIDVTPDVSPVISPVAKLPGYFLATGFSGHGFGLGPGAGRLMADLVTGAPPIVDPKPFRFERYDEPNPPQPSPIAL